MYEAIKALIEACKHVGMPEKMFLEGKIKAAEDELARLENTSSLPDSIKEALNSGDGVYRP